MLIKRNVDLNKDYDVSSCLFRHIPLKFSFHFISLKNTTYNHRILHTTLSKEKLQ